MLPTNDNDLETLYTAQDVIDVSAPDEAKVCQVGLLEHMVHQFKNFVSVPSGVLHWEGQSTLAPSASTVYLQIYNQNTDAWETVDTDNTTADGVNFTLSAFIADFTDYKVGGVVSCRVYQLAI